MQRKRKLPLTRNVKDGLRSLAGVAEAGSSDDFLSFSIETADEEEKKAWENVLKACRWIWDVTKD